MHPSPARRLPIRDSPPPTCDRKAALGEWSLLGNQRILRPSGRVRGPLCLGVSLVGAVWCAWVRNQTSQLKRRNPSSFFAAEERDFDFAFNRQALVLPTKGDPPQGRGPIPLRSITVRDSVVYLECLKNRSTQFGCCGKIFRNFPEGVRHLAKLDELGPFPHRVPESGGMKG